MHWQTGTARLLPRLLQGRTTGPVFLTDRRAPASGRRAPAATDIDPTTSRGRLSYPWAELLFKQATALIDPYVHLGEATSGDDPNMVAASGHLLAIGTTPNY